MHRFEISNWKRKGRKVNEAWAVHQAFVNGLLRAPVVVFFIWDHDNLNGCEKAVQIPTVKYWFVEAFDVNNIDEIIINLLHTMFLERIISYPSFIRSFVPTVPMIDRTGV